VETVIKFAKKLLPSKVVSKLLPFYHFLLAITGAVIYRFPSNSVKVVAVTGTKGKSSTVEIANAILEEAGFRTAILSTIRFKIGNESKPNLLKMTTPGRFFVQKFIRDAVNAKCDYVVLEMSSEAAKQFRHKFISYDALIFTNLSPEHIESHGSYENYVNAKLSIGKELEKSGKQNRALVVNADEKESERFLKLKIPTKLSYSLDESAYKTEKGKISFNFDGQVLSAPLEGKFNIYNCLAGATYAKSQGIDTETIKKALEKIKIIRGRVEHINCGQDFDVVVDYAHTADSLEKLYQAFPNQRKIAVLGNTGGGRDTWKRPVMAEVADKYCNYIILTNEDPYDEDPREIINQMIPGIKNHKPEIIMDRRGAIEAALRAASPSSVVLITGKGTDPFIMGPNGSKTPWDDATVVREELSKLLKKK
jgi:UDP-N-acetylmuramoyl-L-alanyl-D-glutamate--2,6-diaminopimelate ligase